MPYKSESIPIAGTKLDQRRKLSNEQREAVKILADKGYSQRKLAEMFNVSKSLVQSILNPQQRAAQKKRSAAYWAEAKRKYRQRKHQLYKTGKLSEKKTKRHRTISSFIKATLPIYGMVSKRDFVVSDDHVKLSKHPQRGRVLAILKQEYPQYTFYWMTPKVLAWC